MMITLGRSNRKPHGWRVEVPDPFCDNLGSTLEAHTFQGESEAWWSPFVFEGDYRKLDNWQGAQCVAIDADFYSRAEKAKDRHSVPPPETVTELQRAMDGAAVVCSCWHLTPRGVRFVFALDTFVDDRAIMEGVVAGCAALVNEGLMEAGLAASFDAKGKPVGGYLSDTAAMDLAHFMYTPTALVNGKKRDAAVLAIDAGAFPSAELASYVPTSPAANPKRVFVNTAKVGEVGRTLAKMECEGGNDGSGALMKVARKAIQLGITDAEAFVSEVEAWNSRRQEPWLREDLIKRFNDALARFAEEGRVHVPTTKDGKPIFTLGSLTEILKGDSLFREDGGKSVFWFDTMKQTIMGGAEPVTDELLTAIRIMIADKYDKTQTIQKEAAKDALVTVARETEIHPVEAYLTSLPDWDGVERVNQIAWEVLGSKEPIHTTYIRKWLVSAVARIVEPGCQADAALVLLGEQYAGKGSFFKAIAKQKRWHSGSEIDLEFRQADALRVIHGFWIYEIEELDKIYSRNGSAGKLKTFMSQQEDTYIAKYEAFAKTYPRRFIFGASANEDDVLRDPTGDRRFWCIWVDDEVRYLWIVEQVDQIWAEVLRLYAMGEKWHMNKEENMARHEANALFRPDNLAEDKIEELLKNLKYPEKVVSGEMLRRLFPQNAGDLTRLPYQVKIAFRDVMRRNGYTKKQFKINGTSIKGWLRTK